MSGIYIHIPFCKQACIYCDFHFSTTLKNKAALLTCINKELELRKEELTHEPIQSIYFGGGTPSICTKAELAVLLETINKNYAVDPSCEITLEANPDDLTKVKIDELKSIGINRLSIGVQSFFEEDLVWMHRAHSVKDATACIDHALQGGISNISVDLIFATPLLTDDKLEKNIKILTQLAIPHLSCYNLTIEEKTSLHHLVKLKKVVPVLDEVAVRQFYFIRNHLQQQGYEHYEISNYAKPGSYSKHNTSYWQRKKYLGVGPSAHSYTGYSRSWNIRNNETYIRSLTQNKLPSEMETLTMNNRFNEVLLTGLRTQWGVNLTELKQEFQTQYTSFQNQIIPLVNEAKLIVTEDKLTISPSFLIMADRIASELFII